jgi:hypothetical protein
MSYLDPDDFPFTLEELRRAFAMAGDPGEAAQMAGEIAELVTEGRRMAHAARDALARGSRDPETHPASFAASIDLYALLWCLPECSARVDEMMEAQWRVVEQGHVKLILAQRGERTAPPPADVVREARRRVAPRRAGWTRRKRAMAERLGVPRPDGSRRG